MEQFFFHNFMQKKLFGYKFINVILIEIFSYTVEMFISKT